MATQEERLTAVEQFTQEAARHIRETEENTTIMLGVIRSQGQDIRRIFERLDTMSMQLDTVAGQLNDHTVMLAQILAKLDKG